MPLPKPRSGEPKKDFISRCMNNDVMQRDYPNNEQRVAVCNTQWRNRNKDEVNQLEHETLDFEFEIKAIDDDEPGTFEGYASVFGEKDVVDDIVQRGAFSRTLRAHKRKKRMPALLWQHNSREPIGIWKELKEDKHGLYGKGKLLIDDIAKAKEAHALLKDNGLSGLSIGFRTVESILDEKRKVRILTDVELFEVSLVTFPALDSARISNVKSEIVFNDLPFAHIEYAWNSKKAKSRIFEWAGKDEEKFNSAFLVINKDVADARLLITDIINGELTIVPNAVFCAAALLSGARGGIDASENDKAKARDYVSFYYEKMRKEFSNNDLIPPWDIASDGDFERAVKEVLRLGRDVSITERECEKILRDVGFSERQAKALMAKGYEGMIQRDVGDADSNDEWKKQMQARIKALSPN